jgi:hypothetical protein
MKEGGEVQSGRVQKLTLLAMSEACNAQKLVK